eukprot:CAMPEP_0114981838 /NCGR_PEP_ID=MMETSP0216-20121206/5759_1 /TAXON_ID=223996 /ORGANISM="Protocruzia adherens, Strain Boccale" /LENGTH=553 /DNA_ID=CAMNT_0002343539 /DNA_START=119 /DNA_END=1780 /DNA_ORIENTATION=+
MATRRVASKKYLLNLSRGANFSSTAGGSKEQGSRIQASPETFLKKELSDNPEFLRAFPHLEGRIPNVNYKTEEKQPFIESLTYSSQRRNIPEDEVEEIQNKTFVDGYRTPRGPIKWMSEKAKDKVHQQIDLRLLELETSGLSREEILYEDAKGLPLRNDPFFQFIKHNRSAREMLLKPGEEFTVDRVVEAILRQDVGPDSSVALDNKNQYYYHELGSGHDIGAHLSQRPERQSRFDTRTYELTEAQKKEVEFDKTYGTKGKKYRFPHQTMSKFQFRKKFKRSINLSQVNWKNTELLTKFLTAGGKMKNRFQTRLPNKQHRKVMRAVIQARSMCLLPFAGNITAVQKQSLGDITEEISRENQKVLNTNTGEVFTEKYNPLKDSLRTVNNPDYFGSSYNGDKDSINLSHVSESVQNEQFDLLDASNSLANGNEDSESLKGYRSTLEARDATDMGMLFLAEKSLDTDALKDSASESKTRVDQTALQNTNVKQLLDEIEDIKIASGMKFTTTLYQAMTEPRSTISEPTFVSSEDVYAKDDDNVWVDTDSDSDDEVEQ